MSIPTYITNYVCLSKIDTCSEGNTNVNIKQSTQNSNMQAYYHQPETMQTKFTYSAFNKKSFFHSKVS